MEEPKDAVYIGTNSQAVRPITPDDIDLWRADWLSHKNSYESIITYQSFVRRFVKSSAYLTQSALNNFKKQDGTNNNACNSALKSFARFLVDKQGFPDSLLSLKFDRVQEKRPQPKTISEKELELIMNQLDSLRYKMLTYVVYILALRIREALTLKWKDFSWADWLIDKTSWGKVSLIATKGGQFRTLPVPPDLMALLYDKHELKGPDGIPVGTLVFPVGNPKDYFSDKKISDKKKKPEEEKKEIHNYIDFAKRTYRRALNKASLDAIGESISPHVLRHSRAQSLLDKGMPLQTIQRMLGHRSIATTQIYAQASIEDVKRELERIRNG